MDLSSKKLVVIVQCHIVMERCSGYFCEKAFHERTGGFAQYGQQPLRAIYLTCGGCCGRALHRKLCNLIGKIQKKEGIGKEALVVQLASCITKDNFHAPPCPHLAYLRRLIGKLGLDIIHDTHISQTAERRRQEGLYRS